MYNREGGYRKKGKLSVLLPFSLSPPFLIHLQLLPTRAGNGSALQGFFARPSRMIPLHGMFLCRKLQNLRSFTDLEKIPPGRQAVNLPFLPDPLQKVANSPTSASSSCFSLASAPAPSFYWFLIGITQPPVHILPPPIFLHRTFFKIYLITQETLSSLKGKQPVGKWSANYSSSIL